MSDVHFEPFWDPGKVARLAASPVSGWRNIFESPASPDRLPQFSDLEKSCHMRGEDTSFALFESALRAMRAHAGAAHFVIVSGDLIAHGFDCKYNSLFPNAAPADYRAFVEKTIAFVTGGAGPGCFLRAPLCRVGKQRLRLRRLSLGLRRPIPRRYRSTFVAWGFKARTRGGHGAIQRRRILQRIASCAG